MKTWKHGIIGILAIIALALDFTACNDKPDPEQPEYRETTITLNFGSNAYDIKVSGTLLVAEWNGVPNKVETLLETAYPTTITTVPEYAAQVAMDNVCARTGANVVVENTDAYPNYKIIGNGITLYLRFSVLNSITIDSVRDAVGRMENNGTHSN